MRTTREHRQHGTTALIMAARAIVRGDISRARAESQGCKLATVAEARALAGACRIANKRWGLNLRWINFIGYQGTD